MPKKPEFKVLFVNYVGGRRQYGQKGPGDLFLRMRDRKGGIRQYFGQFKPGRRR